MVDWGDIIRMASIAITLLSFGVWLAYRFGRFESVMLSIQNIISRFETRNHSDHTEMKQRLDAHGSALDEHGERIATIEGAHKGGK